MKHSSQPDGAMARLMLRRSRVLAGAALGWLLGAAVPAWATPFAYITNQGSHDVSVIDLPSQKVVATVPVGRSPAGVAVSSAAGRVFVTNSDSRTVSVIGMRSQRVEQTLQGGDGPVGIAVAQSGSQLYVADWYANRLLVFKLVAGTATSTALPGTELPAADFSIALGRAPAGVAASEREGVVFVAERDDDSVAQVDLGARAVRSRVRVGSHPFALLLDAPRQRLYALNVQSNDVSVLDIRDPLQLRVIATIAVGSAPYGAALTSDGALLYVSNQYAGSVSVIDAASLTVLRTLSGFDYPEGVAAHADRVYVVNWMTDQVSVLDARSGQHLASIPTGSNSRGFGAFIGAETLP